MGRRICCAGHVKPPLLPTTLTHTDSATHALQKPCYHRVNEQTGCLSSCGFLMAILPVNYSLTETGAREKPQQTDNFTSYTLGLTLQHCPETEILAWDCC